MRLLEALVFWVLVAILSVTARAQDVSSSVDLAVLERAVFEQVNAVRVTNGLPALAYSDELAVMAQAHTIKMAALAKLSHDGFKERFALAQGQIAGLNALGENVAMNLPREDLVADTVKNWMNSPVHRANILKANNLTGVGVSRAANGNYYFTQIFGRKPGVNDNK